jgi:hypothetical protein
MMIASAVVLAKQSAPYQLFPKAMANTLSTQTHVSIAVLVPVLAPLVLLLQNN